MFLRLSCRRHDFLLIGRRYVQHCMCPGAGRSTHRLAHARPSPGLSTRTASAFAWPGARSRQRLGARHPQALGPQSRAGSQLPSQPRRGVDPQALRRLKPMARWSQAKSCTVGSSAGYLPKEQFFDVSQRIIDQLSVYHFEGTR
jgi:hypothetical protein